MTGSNPEMQNRRREAQVHPILEAAREPTLYTGFRIDR